LRFLHHGSNVINYSNWNKITIKPLKLITEPHILSVHGSTGSIVMFLNFLNIDIFIGV